MATIKHETSDCSSFYYGDQQVIQMYLGNTVVYDMLIDFNYTYSNGTFTLTGWKGTTNGVPSTEIIIPKSDKIML